MIKAYAWEEAATKQVEEARGTELHFLKTLLVLMGTNYAIMFIAPVFVGVVAFLVRCEVSSVVSLLLGCCNGFVCG